MSILVQKKRALRKSAQIEEIVHFFEFLLSLLEYKVKGVIFRVP